MKITKSIDFKDIGVLTQLLERSLPKRFCLELTETEAANALYVAMRAEVASRGGVMNFDDATRSHLLAVARWLIDANGTPGLMLFGKPGNGKTSMARAASRLIRVLSERESYSERKSMRLYTAKNVCRMRTETGRQAEYDRVAREEMIIIDDLGNEPAAVTAYGMTYTPLNDLLSERYASQLMTVITTNLSSRQLRDHYGERVFDRLCEMYTVVSYNNPSYRSRKHAAKI